MRPLLRNDDDILYAEFAYSVVWTINTPLTWLIFLWVTDIWDIKAAGLCQQLCFNQSSRNLSNTLFVLTETVIKYIYIIKL